MIRFLILTFISLSNGLLDETYFEDLELSQLKNGDVFSKFTFSIDAKTSKPGAWSKYVSPVLFEIFDKFSIEDLRLSLAQGQWRSYFWGLPNADDEIPVGFELSAKFTHDSANNASIDSRWSDMVHMLNGIFCTSIIAITPQLTVVPSFFLENNTRTWRYGNLPHEGVCTENLRPFRNMLPCSRSGLVTLLKPVKVFASRYAAFGIRVQRFPGIQNEEYFWDWHIALSSMSVQTTTQISNNNLMSLDKLFGRPLMFHCNIASRSRILVDEKFEIVDGLKNKSSELSNFEKKGKKFNVIHLNSKNIASYFSFKFKQPRKFSQTKNQFNIQVFAKRISQLDGQFVVQMINNSEEDFDAFLMYVIPWHIRIYLHTLKIECNTQVISFVSKFSLPKDRVRPLLIELKFSFPRNSVCILSMDYETAFIKISDFSADAHHGIYVSGPILFINTSNGKEENEFLKLYGDPLLIFLPVPDFSMPFNVICFVFTLIAIFFGNSFTVTTKLMKPVPKSEDTTKSDKTVVEKRSMLSKIRDVISTFLSVCKLKKKKHE